MALHWRKHAISAAFEMENLDRIDRRILFELDRNSRQPISDLARTFRLGRDRIKYRMERLQDRGILQKCAALIDPYRLGFAFYKTYLKLDANSDRRRALEKELRNHPRTYWFAECDGTWDLIWCILAATPLEFRQFQTDVFSKYGSLIIEFDVSTNVEVHAFFKNFLLGKGTGGRRLGGVQQHRELGELDKKLLGLVAKNARLDLGALADQLDSNPVTVKSHLRKLEQEKVIAGYRVDIDLASIGMTFFKAQIYTKSFRQNEEELLCRYCDAHPHITHYIRQVGHCMVELEVDAVDYPHFNSIIRDVREKHSAFVRNAETILVRREQYGWPL